ncbi:MAG: hypothetical protein M5U28_02705 [Sandaracinaceae bacterium]|nr:hypothetical protein [Sandaracinaceae bacterium]
MTGTTTDATPGAVALVDAAAGSELSCATNIATATQNAFLTPGTEVCLAVESGRVAQITVDAVPVRRARRAADGPPHRPAAQREAAPSAGSPARSGCR